jgi:hypothetical protein
MSISNESIIEMLRRSYFAVDGLWFVMIEKDDGFERAMELDERVWQVMPKIQARKARELLDIDGNTPADLARCLALKFAAEGHSHEIADANPRRAEIVISKCPWRDLMESSQRAHLGPEIADRICALEAKTWAGEFSEAIEGELCEAICRGDDRCRFVFTLNDDAENE